MTAVSFDPIGAALAATRQLGTARLRASTQPGTPIPTAGDARLEGVADLRTRTALVRERVLSAEAAARLRGVTGRGAGAARALAALGESDTELLYVGGSRYLCGGAGAGWVASRVGAGPGGPRCAEDPLWLLDALAVPQAVELTGQVQREGAGMRLAGTVDLVAASTAFGARLEQAPRALDRVVRRRRARWARAVPFIVCVDDASLLRRIAYATPPALNGTELWWTTELWDHGCPAEFPSAPVPRR